jgi:glycosyltransferase involved in cell wall biosynthesis
VKTVLVVAYHFPPGGGPGVQRVLKHITYLRDFGWKPVVLTVENGEFPARDESLLKKIPRDVVVERAPIVEPYTMYRKFMGRKGAVDVNVNKSSTERKGFKEGVSEFIRATFFIPDARIGWLLSATKLGRQMIAQHNVQAIYTSSPPYTCALIGKALKRKTHLPWIAGFRDPWTGFLTTPDRWLIPDLIDKRLERSVFTEADAVECAWQGIIEDAIQKLPELDRRKFHHIPNGFDSSDFPVVEPRKNDVFTITYTGSMYGRRNPLTFLQALEVLERRGELKASDIRLLFIGRFGDEVENMLRSTSFASSIETVAYIPHQESIAALMRSDVSLLIVDQAKESAEIVPGKVYEYLGVGKPVLALAPADSAIQKLIDRSHAGRCVPQEDVEAIAVAILEFYRSWHSGLPLTQPDTEFISSFERRESAKQLAHILDGLTGGVS